MLDLKTQRLHLRHHVQANAALINRWDNDPELLYYDDNKSPDRPPTSMEETRHYIQRVSQEVSQPTNIHYAIHKQSNDELIGTGVIAFIDRYNRNCRIGLVIGKTSEWGQGYARETLEAVIGYCFRVLHVHRIGAEIYPFNERSIRLFEGLGFQFEGRRQEAVFKDGRFVDELLYRLLRHEWTTRR